MTEEDDVARLRREFGERWAFAETARDFGAPYTSGLTRADGTSVAVKLKDATSASGAPVVVEMGRASYESMARVMRDLEEKCDDRTNTGSADA